MNKQVLKYLVRFFIFSLPFLIWVYLVSFKNSRILLDQNETESNLYIIPKNKHYKYVFLGASQSRTFTRETNYKILDSIIGKENYLNLSKGGGGGILPAMASLQYFYDRGNSVDLVIFFISPRAFYSKSSNENHPFFTKEPFRIDFLDNVLLNDKLPWKNRKQYIYQIWNGNLGEDEMQWKHHKSDEVFKVDNKKPLNKAKQRLNAEMESGALNILSYKMSNYKLIELCKKNKSKIVYVLLPSLMTNMPGIKMTKDILKESRTRLIDWSNERIESIYFYDYMHFNRRGVKYFFENYFDKLNQ